ncbi:MAG: hypothetical protein CMM02_12065 [Rhodopirellula sp.]|jgi:hypothetical protein|nr:hypothetical protein [Rhodopirellula sp.]|tara:strand:+ start:1447 stop:2670 length:1224 start_codon:yes stop_codon:yes gene_type:complete
MAKNEEKVVEEVQPTETKNESTEVEKEGGDMKVTEETPEKVEKPETPKNEAGDFKLDFSNKPEEVVEEKEDLMDNTEANKFKTPEKQEEVVEEKAEQPILEEVEVSEEEVQEKVEEVKEDVEQAVEQAQQTGEPLPENIQKVVDFINDTGGSLDDYVRLNQDYTKHDDKALLREYYKQTKPHLTDDEVQFIMEDKYSWTEEEEEDEKLVKRKKLALKEQVADARAHLDGLKSKYYEEIKAGSNLTEDQQKAVDFFNRYNEDAKVSEEQSSIFIKKTDNVFSNKFKGFEYNVGEKKYRFNVRDVDKVKKNQSDIGNFISKFTNKNNEMEDAQGYHKSLFTAMNPDLVANHFYEQGRADAIKDSVAKAKNVDMDPRKTHEKVQDVSGFKVRAVPSGDSSSDFKFKIKRK